MSPELQLMVVQYYCHVSPTALRDQYTALPLEVVLKFGDGDGPNLCRVKKVDVSSTFIENIFRSRLTLVSS